MVSSGFQIDTQSLIAAYLKEKINHLSKTEQSARQIQNMAENLTHLKTTSFNFLTDIPDGLLERFIESILFYEGKRGIRNFEKMLPDGVIQLVISLDDHERVCINGAKQNSNQIMKEAWVSGVQKKARTFLIPPDEKTLTIRFKPGGFFAITGIPASEITDSLIPADQIFGPTFNDFRNNLKTIEKPQDSFKKLKHYLIKRYQRTGVSINNGLNVITDISSKPVQKLADETGISHKHLIHISKKQIGLSPKYFQRILRFGNTLKEIISLNRCPDWGDIVYKFSYYDQPHLINEFRHFSGFSPQTYLETGNICSKYLHLNINR
jgi:AraC-like DNA-binding protein